jgi:hypothetical protein
MNSFSTEIDPEDLEFVIYEQVFRERWWKPLLESIERSRQWDREDEEKARKEKEREERGTHLQEGEGSSVAPGSTDRQRVGEDGNRAGMIARLWHFITRR